MTTNDVVKFKNIYSKHRKVTMDRQATYEQLVVADVTITNLVSWIQKDIDNIRANVPLKSGEKANSEAAMERLFKNGSIEERHLLRICEGLLSTIKSKMYRETK
jgi:hypothetical protein